jgi:DNA-binding response OmpR family regulator
LFQSLYRGTQVEPSPLKGCSILVVEDEPLIAMDVQLTFEGSGAELHIANSIDEAMPWAKRDGLCLGVLDYGLADGKCTELYRYLQRRGVPFIIYTGYDVPEDQRYGGVVVSKPALGKDLLAIADKLLARCPRRQMA